MNFESYDRMLKIKLKVMKGLSKKKKKISKQMKKREIHEICNENSSGKLQSVIK